jgi:hypothetical protein
MSGGMQRLAIVLGAMACCLAGAAVAQEYCVACTEPAALYRCVIDGARPGGGQSLQLLCVTTMAKSGGHATCAVKGGTVFECNGPIKRVPWVASDHPPQPGAAQAPAAPVATQSPVPISPEEPPKTMVELAKRANEQTTEQMKMAGEKVKSTGQAIGEATKKTWDCVVSFFTRC